MKWFHDLKVGRKLVGSFLLVALLVVVVGYLGLSTMGQMNQDMNKLYAKQLIPVSQLLHLVEGYQRTRVNLRDVVIAPVPRRRKPTRTGSKNSPEKTMTCWPNTKSP